MKSLPPLSADADQSDYDTRKCLLNTQCRILTAQLQAKGENVQPLKLEGADVFEDVAALDAHAAMLESKLDGSFKATRTASTSATSAEGQPTETLTQMCAKANAQGKVALSAQLPGETLSAWCARANHEQNSTE